ncbi:MAG: hypothetical protein KAT83_00545 [Candidatus Aenigmarchaeota archaeon]|nr:hypothetical protein [Candidatus Aenigmarchaeota archaeon]
MDSFIQKIIKYKCVVRLFLQNPERRYTPLELSRISHIPYASVWRFIQKLKAKKMILVERIGAYNICRLNKKFPKLSALKTFLSSSDILSGSRKRK